MRLRQGTQWITITAEDQPFGSTINVDYINDIRWQPKVVDDKGVYAVVPGVFQVVITTAAGGHTLAYDTMEKAQREYERLRDELTGVPANEQVH